MNKIALEKLQDPQRLDPRIKLISADNHVNEPRDVFTARVPQHLRDKAPRVMEGVDGGEGWSYDGKTPKRTFGIEAMAGFEKKDYKLGGMRFDDLRVGNYDPAEHLKDMDIDGIYASVVYPDAGIGLYNLESELAVACMKAYNDWILDDFQAHNPKRLVGLALLPTIQGIDIAVAEMERCAKKGAKGCFIPGGPDVPYNHPTHYEKLWSAASDLNLAMAFHRNHGGKPDKSEWDELVDQRVSIGGIVTRYFSGVRPLSYMIFAGVFERHPRLRIVGAEIDCGWVPFWVQTMVHHWENQKSWFPVKLKTSPDQFIGVNIFTSNIDDYVGYDLVKTGKYPYLANMTMFSSDYPHSATIWPNSQAIAVKMTEGMKEEDKVKVLGGNTMRLYNISP
jgi:predicted TIM-barrel fold metal-dependent hydrolase